MKNFLTFQILLYLIFLCSFTPVDTKLSDCKEIDVQIEVFNTSGGIDNGKVKLKFAEDANLFNVHLFQSSKSYKLDVDKQEIANLRKGNYTILVTARAENSPYCSRHFKVKIQ